MNKFEAKSSVRRALDARMTMSPDRLQNLCHSYSVKLHFVTTSNCQVPPKKSVHPNLKLHVENFHTYQAHYSFRCKLLHFSVCINQSYLFTSSSILQITLHTICFIQLVTLTSMPKYKCQEM